MLIEDDKGLWPLYTAALIKYNIELTKVATAGEAHKLLNSTTFDLAIVDYQLPDATGISIVELFGQKLACVLVTAMGDEGLVVEAMQKGAKDYLVKDTSCHFLNLLPSVISKAVKQSKLQKELNSTRERMRAVFDQASDLMIVTNHDFRIVDVSKNATIKYATRFLQLGHSLDHWVDRSKLLQLAEQRVEEGSVELVLGTQTISFKMSCRPLIDNELLFVFQDISDALEIKKAEKVIATINKEKNDLLTQNRLLASRSNLGVSTIIGFTNSILALRKTISNVADTDASILIVGETGTGKELVANEIHYQSARKDMPLIKLNCASIPENLVESELFGHVKGAFTGAIKDRVGKFEQANGGTLFLDEIGEMGLSSQAKLLRVLQEGNFEAVGGSQLIQVDVRIIAATNRNLSTMVKHGKFRADLFYRLNVIPVTVPPLRKRADDIILLANHFIDRYCTLYGREKPILFDERLKYLRDHNWPGNIRELQNSMERLVVLGQLDAENFSDIDKAGIDQEPDNDNVRLVSMADIERQHMLSVLAHCKWQVSGNNGAAKILNLNPNTMRFRMQKLDIKKASNPQK